MSVVAVFKYLQINHGRINALKGHNSSGVVKGNNSHNYKSLKWNLAS